jgi:hypothetical protein
VILLFDVDGVLVENRAYRAAIQHTVAYFSRRLGLELPPPTEAEIEVFEAESITVEWDTSGIVVAALLFERLRRDSALARPRAALDALPADVWQALDALRANRLPGAAHAIDYAALARRVGAETRARGGLPARAALQLFLADLEANSHIPAGAARPLLEHLLGDIYTIENSPAMQVFQNYVLGDQRYGEYYDLAPLVAVEGLLEHLDRPLLVAPWPAELLRRRVAGGFFPVLYTARPSLAPLEAGGRLRGYTPEAEVARALVELEGVPAMGFGKVDWVARRVGLTGSDLVKPSPVQAMAAMAAACTGLEVEAVKAALAVARGDHLRYPLTACAGQTVHVFEDSPSSLGGVTLAVELLNRQALGLRLVRHGIAPAGSPKRATLATAADAIHADVGEALETCVGA